MVSADRFFVVHLTDDEANQLGGKFEVQLLDNDGRAGVVIYAKEIGPLLVSGVSLSSRALERVAGLPPGQGLYLDQDGSEISPF
jgi:hypothetical protein